MNYEGVRQEQEGESELEQPLERRVRIRAIGCRDGSDRDESRAREQLAEDDAEREPEGFEPCPCASP